MLKAFGVSRSLLFAGLVVFPAVAATPASAADFSKPGPFAIGVQEFAIPDATGEQVLQTYVWYPASGPAADAADKILSTPDAPPATTGPYPLVVLISGLGMGGSTYKSWGKLLASHGFVAFASTYDHFGGGGVGPRLLYGRPADVIRVIGYADMLTASDGKLAGLIDTSHIGVWGMSTGGTTALQAGGARIDFKALNEWCAANEPEKYGESCQFVGEETSTAKLYGVADPLAQPMPPIWDNRVAALVLASPGGELQVFGAAGIAAVKVPTLVMVASDDGMVKPKFNGLWAYDGIGSADKALAVFDKGGHALFVGFGPRVEQSMTLTIAFFLDILKSDPAGKAAVLSDAVSFPGLSYKTTFH
jgi:predicted dienelactone hydrolase